MDKLFRTDKLLTGPTQVITPNSLSNLALKQCTSSFNRNIIIRTPTVIDKMETPLNKKKRQNISREGFILSELCSRFSKCHQATYKFN